MRRRNGAVAGVVLLALVLAGGPSPDPAGAAGPPGIRGVARDADGQPVPGALVAALRTTDYSAAGTTAADGAGAYQLDDLAAGSYLLYLLDPDGQHVPGFHGAPATITVGSGWTDVDPVLQPARGSIAGEVTGPGGGALEGVLVLALSGVDGRVAGGTTTDEDGTFQVDDLLARDHLLAYIDPTGAHVPEYHDDTDIAGADRVPVVAGEVQDVSAQLAATTPPAHEATLQGRITEDGTGDPVAGWVVALDATTYQAEGAARSGSDGRWTLPVDAGGHRLVALDPAAAHATEWYPDLPYDALATSGVVTVASGATATVDMALTPTTASLTGTLTEDGSGDEVADGWAVAIGPDGALAAVADADGGYRIDGIPAGEVRATFLGPGGLQQQEYWDSAAGYGDADPLVLAGGEVRTLDVSLAGRPCGTTVPAAPTRCVVGAPAAPGPAWATWTIPTGAHSANAPVHGAQAPSTLHGWFVSPGRLARRYQFVFDGSARYVLTNPTQPEDQLDWNKLPGLSDCGTNDLAVNGWMFAWRWRTDLTPRVLEITAYANNNSTHLWPDEPLLTLTSAQLDARLPLWFDLRVSADRTRYEFTVRGPGTRLATTTLPRACTTTSPSWQWPGGFYFGGTSTAPSTITGLMRELPT